MRKGFSMVELLVAVALVGVLLGTLNVLLFTSLRSARKAESVGITKTEGANAMEAMADLIKYARRVVGGSVPCQGNSLEVERFNGRVVRYELLGGRIASSSGTVTSRLTSNAVVAAACQGRAMFVCGEGDRSVNICFTLSRTGVVTAEDRASVRFETTVRMRNTDN